jgi:hypothetical protein
MSHENVLKSAALEESATHEKRPGFIELETTAHDDQTRSDRRPSIVRKTDRSNHVRDVRTQGQEGRVLPAGEGDRCAEGQQAIRGGVNERLKVRQGPDVTEPGRRSGCSAGWLARCGNHTYLSGTPIALTTTVSFPLGDGTFLNTPTITTYNGWGGTYTGRFDPNADRFFQAAYVSGPQSTTQYGNATRTNPKLRNFSTLNENISLAKSFAIHESVRLEFRAESFNFLNRTIFGPSSGALSLQSPNFGLWATQANTPRTMQLALKVYF